MINTFYKFLYICLLLFLFVIVACGKRGVLERPLSEDNLEPAIVEENK